ncbi:hypothetical protein JKG47_13320 [Acidithiobacillus sp. MC6.1]|nr:hypothetical protein [Acidithiobacillus sp. MC6.1]
MSMLRFPKLISLDVLSCRPPCQPPRATIPAGAPVRGMGVTAGLRRSIMGPSTPIGGSLSAGDRAYISGLFF